ncbi:unnamed protein product, partial [Mesorhabditis spiculigera]
MCIFYKQSAPPDRLTLEDLVAQLRRTFSEDEVDVQQVMKMLESYKSLQSDWAQYAKWDPNKYTRNLVDEGNGKYNLMVLCWPCETKSPIHDHTGSHCFVKVLDGELTETRYKWPENEGAPPFETEVFHETIDNVCYMNDKLGLHRMANPSDVKGAVTLHLYIPPYGTCNNFDEKTGNRRKCQVTFFSKYGDLVSYRSNRDGPPSCGG